MNATTYNFNESVENHCRAFAVEKFLTLSGSELDQKCDELARKNLPFIREIIQACCKPYSRKTSYGEHEAEFTKRYQYAHAFGMHHLENVFGIKLRQIYIDGPVGYGIMSSHVRAYSIVDSGVFKICEMKEPLYPLSRNFKTPDFSIVCGHITLSTHREVLKQCEYFKMLLDESKDTDESITGVYTVKANDLMQSETNFRSVERVVDFIYAKRINFNDLKTVRQVCELMAAANLFLLPELKNGCIGELINRVLDAETTEEDFETILNFAEGFEIQEIIKVCQMIKSIQANFV